MAKNKEHQPIRPILDGLGIGSWVEYPLERYDVIKSTASILGTIRGRVYSTKIQKESNTVRVTRML